MIPLLSSTLYNLRKIMSNPGINESDSTSANVTYELKHGCKKLKSFVKS